MMEDTDEFKLAVKVVIKRQMRDLMEQLREKGEEIAILTVNLDDNSCSHFGSPNGEWFISEQKNITKNFLTFCQTNSDYRGMRPSNFQKKKSISTLKDSSSKQSLSSEIPEVKVTIPKNLAGELSEEEVASVVGRVVATHLAEQEKGDGSSSGTQFDLLVRTVHHSKQKGTSSMISTPSTRSARKRKPTAKFMEGMNSLKKSKKSEEEDSEVEVGHDETNVISLLKELNNAVLKRVKVSITDDQAVNLEKSTIEASETVESLAILVIQELDTLSGGQLANRKSIKVHVVVEESGSEDVEIIIRSSELDELRNEDMDDSDMEYLDEEDEDDDYIDGSDDNDVEEDDDDDNFEINMENIREIKVEKDTGSYAEMSHGVEPRSKRTYGTKRRPPSETRPTPCPHCDAVLTGVSSLNAHIRRVHLKVRNYACNICSKRFFTSTHRDDHFTSIHIRKCPNCNLDVCEKIPWTETMTATSPRDVRCNCGATVRIQSKYGRFKNKDDPELFDENGKRKPRSRKRALSEITPMKCQKCNVILKGKSSLNAHIRRMHLMSREHVCTVCSKAFFSKTHLESHMLSLHARRCQVCQEYVMESEHWGPDMDRWTERNLTCSCGASVTIVTKLGRKPENGSDDDYQPKKRVKRDSAPGARYVCGSCGKIFLKKKNAMSHTCSSRQGELEKSNNVNCDVCKESFQTEDAMREHVTKMHAVQQDEKGVFTVEGEGVIIDEDNQVVMLEDSDAQTALTELTEGSQFQVMHDGKLVPVEQVVDPDGNISFIIKSE